MPTIDMAGQKFGRLTVVKKVGARHDNGAAIWLAICECGGRKNVDRGSLRSGKTKSCGCLASEAGKRNCAAAHLAKTKHGASSGGKYTKLYRTWLGMKARCHTPSAGNYSRYGAKGISVCDEWRKDFKAFAAHVGDPPSDAHSIDRIDNSIGYVPGNVRWATAKEQANNRGAQNV